MLSCGVIVRRGAWLSVQLGSDSDPVKMSKSSAKKKKEVSREDPRARSAQRVSRRSEAASNWTFLTNHAHVLAVLHSDRQIVLRQVAIDVGITERAVQRIIQDLEDGGFIRREKVGRKNRYEILTKQPLRHPIESHRKIGDLLKLIHK